MLRRSWRSVTEGVCGTDLGSARHHAFKPERITVIDAPTVDRPAESRSDELFLIDSTQWVGGTRNIVAIILASHRNVCEAFRRSWAKASGRKGSVASDIAGNCGEDGRPGRETGAWADSRCLHRWNIGPRQYSASAGSQSSGFIGSAVVLAVRRAWCGNLLSSRRPSPPAWQFLDAGALATAAQAGARYRSALIWSILVGTTWAMTLMEMAGWLASVSSDAVRDAIG